MTNPAETIQRYRVTSTRDEGYAEDGNGEFVEYQDHTRILAAALAEVEGLRLERDAARNALTIYAADYCKAEAERDEALAKLAQVTGVDEGAKWRALLIDARGELGRHKFSEDGEYNNDDVIEMCERIDEALRMGIRK